jgi:hypothetical protein
MTLGEKITLAVLSVITVFCAGFLIGAHCG